MMTMKFAEILLFGFVSIVCAQTVDSNVSSNRSTVMQEFSPVLVQALGNPATASFASLLRGVAAFNANKQLAPEAPLVFQAFDRSQLGIPLSLRIETEDKIIPIEVNKEGLFTLPSADDVGVTDGELVANRRSGNLIIRPKIQSPGFGNEYRRLGDHRLWCEVVAAIDEDNASLPLRLKVLLHGGMCKSSRIRMFQMYRGEETLARVELGQGDRKIAGIIKVEENSFYLPMHDLSWSNDATFRLTFEPAQQAFQTPDAKQKGS